MYATGRLADSERQNDEKMLWIPSLARQFFRHFTVLSLPAGLLRKVPIKECARGLCKRRMSLKKYETYAMFHLYYTGHLYSVMYASQVLLSQM